MDIIKIIALIFMFVISEFCMYFAGKSRGFDMAFESMIAILNGEVNKFEKITGVKVEEIKIDEKNEEK